MYINSGVRFARLSAGRTPNTSQDFQDSDEREDESELRFQDSALLLKRCLCNLAKAKCPMQRFACGYAQSPLLAWRRCYLQLKAQQLQSGHVRLLSESHFEIHAWWKVCSQGNLATLSPEPSGTRHTVQLSSTRPSGHGTAERPWTSAELAAGLATVSSRASNIS